MLFHVYGANALPQWGMMLAVLAALILLNELARRTQTGGLLIFIGVPTALTFYFVWLKLSADYGLEWAQQNQTTLYMNGWFHYAKLYAALAGSIGFMMIKYRWGIGAKHWFKPFPFVIVAVNILIAVISDFESAHRGWHTWWFSSEGVWLYGTSTLQWRGEERGRVWRRAQDRDSYRQRTKTTVGRHRFCTCRPTKFKF